MKLTCDHGTNGACQFCYLSRALAILLLLAVCPLAYGQPKIDPKAKVIVPATMAAKGGKLLLIDASAAKGDVKFGVDSSIDSIIDGKKLYLSVPRCDDARTFTVRVISWADQTEDIVTISVSGEAAPKPKPPVIVPPTNTEIMDAIKALAARVAALEGSKPPPVPVDPPVPVKAERLNLVMVWESADSTPAIAKVIKDVAFWKSLEPLGHDFFELDKDAKDKNGNRIIDTAGYAAHVDKAGLPTLIIMDRATNKVVQAVRLPATTADVRSLVKQITGK